MSPTLFPSTYMTKSTNPFFFWNYNFRKCLWFLAPAIILCTMAYTKNVKIWYSL
jgi:hypothetical protein